eukprot:5198684-Amphidinium_carterae.1
MEALLHDWQSCHVQAELAKRAVCSSGKTLTEAQKAFAKQCKRKVKIVDRGETISVWACNACAMWQALLQS